MAVAAPTPTGRPVPGLPPGPRDPGALQLLNWVLRPWEFVEHCGRRYGDVFTLSFAPIGTVVFVGDPVLIKRIHTGPPDILRAGEGNVSLDPVLGRHSLLRLDGDAHLRERRMLLPAFHGRRIERYRDLIGEVTERELAAWPQGEAFALQPSMQAITLEVILRAVFGFDETERVRYVGDLIRRLMAIATDRRTMIRALREGLRRPPPGTPFGDALDAVDAALYAQIAARRADPALGGRDDILAMLVEARDQEGRPLGDRHLRDELMTMLVAGHETTATALAWAFERLLRNPAAASRLAEEARAGNGHAYADAVVEETLRVRAPLILTARVLAEPWELDGWLLPAGTTVGPCVYLANRRPETYPDPEAFRPERFLDRKPDTYAWIPFGGGVRRCIGAAFAQLEMRVVLQTVLAACELSPAAPESERPRRRAVVSAPEHGARAVLVARRGTCETISARRAP